MSIHRRKEEGERDVPLLLVLVLTIIAAVLVFAGEWSGGDVSTDEKKDGISEDLSVAADALDEAEEAAALEEVTSDAYLSGFMNSTATARLEETARMTNANEIKTVITEELQYALLGQKTAEQAVADMAARLEAL